MVLTFSLQGSTKQFIFVNIYYVYLGKCFDNLQFRKDLSTYYAELKAFNNSLCLANLSSHFVKK